MLSRGTPQAWRNAGIEKHKKISHINMVNMLYINCQFSSQYCEETPKNNLTNKMQKLN